MDPKSLMVETLDQIMDATRKGLVFRLVYFYIYNNTGVVALTFKLPKA